MRQNVGATVFFYLPIRKILARIGDRNFGECTTTIFTVRDLAFRYVSEAARHSGGGVQASPLFTRRKPMPDTASVTSYAEDLSFDIYFIPR